MARSRKQIEIGAMRGTPQEAFLQSTADIACIGGGAGGGKTYSLLLEPLSYITKVQGFGVVFFRRTTPQLRGEGGLWDQSAKLYPVIEAIPREADLEWLVPVKDEKGRVIGRNRIKLAHLEHDRNRYDWDGTEIPLICFDQVESFTQAQFWHLLGRNRSTCGVRPYVRCSCNPVSDGWLHDLVCSWWIDEEGYPIRDRAGVPRFFVRFGDDLVWGSTPEEVGKEAFEKYGVPRVRPLSFTFFPALPTDNPKLMEGDPAYLAKLEALPRVEKERLLKGNWRITAGAGDYFQRAWCEFVEHPPEDVKERVRSWDLASTRPSSATPDPDWTVGVLLSRAGKITTLEHAIRRRGTPGEMKELIVRTAFQDRELYGKSVKIRVAKDPGQAGVAQADDLVAALDGFVVMKIKPETGDKPTRARPFAAAAEHNLVKIVRGPWNEPFLTELENFPKGRHDDDMDATSGGFNVLAGRELPPPISVGSITRANPFEMAG